LKNGPLNLLIFKYEGKGKLSK